MYSRLITILRFVKAGGLRAYSTALSEVPTAKLWAAAEAVVETRKVSLTTAEVGNVLREAGAPL